MKLIIDIPDIKYQNIVNAYSDINEIYAAIKNGTPLKTAEWEKFGKNTYACTNCRRGVTNREKYCPECGSLMRKEGE